GRGDVVGERRGRVLHDADAVALRAEQAVYALPAGAVDETTVDEDNVLDRGHGVHFLSGPETPHPLGPYLAAPTFFPASKIVRSSRSRWTRTTATRPGSAACASAAPRSSPSCATTCAARWPR